jgi:hypothetical protein
LWYHGFGHIPRCESDQKEDFLMPFRIEVYDGGQWIVKAEGEKAKALVEALGAVVIDLRAILETEGAKEVGAILEREGEIITLISSLADAYPEACKAEGHRVVLARAIFLPLTS